MTRIMLVCPEPLASGQPAGIGIRFIEIANVLAAAGHEVTILSPDSGRVARCRAAALDPQSINTVSASSDVAVIQGHVANDFFAHARAIPTVVDLYDPFIVENLHYYSERGPEVFTHDHATLLGSLAHGDLFLCASEAQRLFYLGMLLAIGRVNPIAFERDPHLDGLIRVAPFGVQPARATSGGRRAASRAILFGGIYDWYDPIAAIEAIAAARKSLPDLTLTFTRHPNPGITPQGKLADAMAHVERNGYDFVEFVPWVAYEQRHELFERHAMALLTFDQSLETDLSMRTRVYDYLWAGLPIITSPAPGTDEILTRYDAGVVIHEGKDLATTIVAILTNPERLAAMAAGTRTFVQEHQWSRTLEPLVDFCASPRIDATKEDFLVSLQMPPRRASILDRIRRRIGASS